MGNQNASLPEILAVIVGLGGLLFSGWALGDDWLDRRAVLRQGRRGGPRWIVATGHLWFNLTLLVAWALYTINSGAAVYLPPRSDPMGLEVTAYTVWFRVALGALFLFAQVHQRVARTLLRRLPREAWIAMFKDMYGRDPQQAARRHAQERQRSEVTS